MPNWKKLIASGSDASLKSLYVSSSIETYDLDTSYLQFNTSSIPVVNNPGLAQWNPIDGTLDISLLNGVTLQTGQEMNFYGKATEAILSGDCVMFAGAQGDFIKLAKATAASINSNPEYFLGVATQDFITNQFGYITTFGKVRNLNTNAYPEGTILYFDSGGSTPGGSTTTIPTAPNVVIRVAAILKQHLTQGTLLVRPDISIKLTDLSDVDGTPLTSTGQFPVWTSGSNYFDFGYNINDYALVTSSVQNNTDIYPTTPPVSQIVSLTAAEYASIGTKDSGTLYVII